MEFSPQPDSIYDFAVFKKFTFACYYYFNEQCAIIKENDPIKEKSNKFF